MLFAKSLVGLGLLNAVTASQQPLADALHSITSHCLSRDTHTACTDYANEQLATCSPDDLNCQCTKISDIHGYCREVCDLSDYVSDSTRLFLDETCKFEEIEKRDVKEQQPSEPKLDGVRSSDIIEGLALKQLLESNQLPHGLSNLVEDKLSPAVAKVKKELHSGIDVTPKGSKPNEGPEKRSDMTRKWMDVNLKMHYLDPQTGEIYPEEAVQDWAEENYDMKTSQEGPRYFYEEHGLLYPVDASIPSMENPPSFYRDTVPPVDEMYFYDPETPASPDEEAITLYFDAPTATAEPVKTGNRTHIMSKLRQKLNIHHVHSAHSHAMTTSPQHYTNSTASTAVSAHRSSATASSSFKMGKGSNSSATLVPQTGRINQASAIKPAFTATFISMIVAAACML